MSREKTGKYLPCAQCSENIYVPKWKLQTNNNNFCSEECHNKFQTNKIERDCEYCGTTMYGIPSQIGKFCSIKCYGKNKTEAGNVTHECDYCGDAFKIHKYRVEEQENCFCSDECTSNWRSEDFSGEANPRFNGGKYRGFGSNWLDVRSKVWDRSNGTCEWCGKTEEDNGRRLSVHHIIPRKKFIEHDTLSVEDSNFMKNLIALCQSCHISAEYGSSHYPNND